MISDLHDAQRAFWRAEEKYHAALKDAIPLESWVYWMHGKQRRNGTVKCVSQDRVRVLGVNGREVWLYTSRIIEIETEEVRTVTE